MTAKLPKLTQQHICRKSPDVMTLGSYTMPTTLMGFGQNIDDTLTKLLNMIPK